MLCKRIAICNTVSTQNANTGASTKLKLKNAQLLQNTVVIVFSEKIKFNGGVRSVAGLANEWLFAAKNAQKSPAPAQGPKHKSKNTPELKYPYVYQITKEIGNCGGAYTKVGNLNGFRLSTKANKKRPTPGRHKTQNKKFARATRVYSCCLMQQKLILTVR